MSPSEQHRPNDVCQPAPDAPTRAPQLAPELTDPPQDGRALTRAPTGASTPPPPATADPGAGDGGEDEDDFTSEPFRTRVATMQAAASVLAGFALFLPPLVLSRGWPMSNWRFLVPLLLSIFCGLAAVSSALDGRGFGRARELLGIMWSDE